MDAEYGIEDLVSYDKEGNKVYPPNPFDEIGSSKQQQEEEIAAKEDAICDDEDADITNIKMCMSDEREHQYEDVQIDKEACKEGGGEYDDKYGCDTKGDEKIADKVQDKINKKQAERELKEDNEQEQEVIEDYGNTVTETNRNAKYFEMQAESINSQNTESEEEALKEVIKNLKDSGPGTNSPIEQKPIEEEEEITESEEQVESSDNEETQEAEESVEADERVEE